MTWVLLRGLTREARHWGGVPAQLKLQLTNTPAAGDVLTPDLPGSGVFHQQACPPSVPAMVDFVRDQLRAQGSQPPWCLLAMSLGGMVATDWAQRYPWEVARLVLINTSMRPFSGITQRLRPGNWFALAALAARWQDAGHAERLIHQLTCNNTATRADDIAAWIHIRKTAPVRATNGWHQLRAASQFSCGEEAPACPTLLLSSRQDRLVNANCSRRLASAWKTPHEIHLWAGHDLPHDDPGWLCQQVARWLL
jgi:pimeloyl-ACP methyl ester carboxylesterase